MSAFHPLYHNILVKVSFSLSAVANYFLAISVLYFSKSWIGTYRYLLVLFSFFNGFYSLIHVVLQPVIHVHHMSFMVFSTRPIPVWSNRIVTSVFASCFAQSLCLFALHFIFRYVYAVRPELRYLFTKKRWISGWIVLYSLIALIYGFVCYFNFGKSDLKDSYWNEELLHSYGVNATEIGYIAPLYEVFSSQLAGEKLPFQYEGRLQELDLVGIGIVSVVIGATLVTIPACTISIWKHQSAITTLSDNLKEKQHQLFKILLVQTALAMIFTFLPSTAVIFTSVFGPKLGDKGNFISLMLTVFSVIDPLILLCSVECYRKAIPKICTCKYLFESVKVENEPAQGTMST